MSRSPIEHLYLHVPFCAKVCPYCAFYVHTGGSGRQQKFADAFCREIGQARERYNFQLQTVYWGGGTPSLLAPDLVKQIAQALPPCGGEITMEVNPATVTTAKAAAWRVAGVNRISLGAQSFDADYLKLLGRQHRSEDVEETVVLLRAEGFGNISIDLMFALPNQPESVWETTLEKALACRPEHLSAYALTYEEDTEFFRRRKKGEWIVDEEKEARMFLKTEERLAAAGLERYEISNFARPGFESRHNRAYWLGKDYLGLGPSAVSTMGGRRWKNIPDTAAYVEKLGRRESLETEIEGVGAGVRAKERIMLGLRMREGIAFSDLEGFPEERERLIGEGLLEECEGRLRLTARGRLVADSVAGLFV
jgi:oxygen-independent coproporphyrinogen-3 oxidase